MIGEKERQGSREGGEKGGKEIGGKTKRESKGISSK